MYELDNSIAVPSRLVEVNMANLSLPLPMFIYLLVDSLEVSNWHKIRKKKERDSKTPVSCMELGECAGWQIAEYSDCILSNTEPCF